MEVNFAPLNADWGLAHLVINSVCFASSVVLTLYVPLVLPLLPHHNTFCMYWMWCFHLPGEGLLGAFQRMLPEQKCITFALAALIFLNQPQSVFYRNSLYYYEGQIAELILYCFSIAAFLTYWLVVIDVMSKQNPQFSSFRRGFWIYKSLFFALFFTAHLLRLSHVLGYARQETGAQNSQSDPDFFEKLGGLYFVRCFSRFFVVFLCFLRFAAAFFLFHGNHLGHVVDQERAQMQPQLENIALPLNSIPTGFALLPVQFKCVQDNT
jgi:hypothetical protein